MISRTDAAPSGLTPDDQVEASGINAGQALATAPPPALPNLPATILATLACQGRPPGLPGAVVFTLIHSDRAATKSYCLDPTTDLPTKGSEPPLSKGTIYRASLPGAKPLAELAGVLSALPPYAVLTCGTMSDSRDFAALATRDQLSRIPSAIARTKGFASYPAGQPGLAMLDHDAKDLPGPLQARLKAAGGLLSVLGQACPEIAQAGILSRPSVSTGIRATTGGGMTQGGGVHLYFVAANGADIPAFIKRLHQRLVLSGWGWVFISKAGRCQVRSLIDTAASGDPERLAFEADAILGAGLEYVDKARVCAVERDGVLFRTSELLELSDIELAQLAKIEADLLDAAAPHAMNVRATAKRDRATKLVASGMLPAKANARMAYAFDQERLDTAETVHLDDGQTPTIADILRAPRLYNGATGADPLEPDYGGGRNKAIWWTDGLNVRCYSHAHGGQWFKVGWAADDLIEAWRERRNPTEVASMYLRALFANPDADKAKLATAGVPTWAALEFGLADLEDFAGMAKRGEWRELADLKVLLQADFDAALVEAATSGCLDCAAASVGLAEAEAERAAAGVIPVNWEKSIMRNREGRALLTLTNAMIGLGLGCGLARHLRFDLSTRHLVLVGVPSGSAIWNALTLGKVASLYREPLTGHSVFAWSDTLLTSALLHLESNFDMVVNRAQAEAVIARIADDGAYSSVGRWLRGLVWDRTPRLDGWLRRHAGGPDTAFARAALARWMIGGVARALFPEERGTPAQMDTALVLVGEQGAGKSQFFRGLCPVPQWHTESSLGNLAGKDALMQLAGHFIVDMAEGSTVKANGIEAYKQFMTAAFDSFRPPYGRNMVQLPRRTVFAMTVNPDGAGFLRDGTGNRRFWVVDVQAIDISQLRRDCDQLWAEAVARFDAGERWWLDKDNPHDTALIAEAAAAAEGHRLQTSLEVLLRRYVAEEPPFDMRSNSTWTPRPVPLTVIGAAPDVLREIGQDKALANSFGDADYRRAATSMGWQRVRVTLRNAPIERNRTIWVSPDGKKAMNDCKRQPGAFQTWLEAVARAGSLGLRPGAGLNEAWFRDAGVALPGAVPAV